jgi:hypothetical protein
MDFKEVGCEGEEWIQMAQDRVQWQVLVNTVMNLWILYKAEFLHQLKD